MPRIGDAQPQVVLTSQTAGASRAAAATRTETATRAEPPSLQSQALAAEKRGGMLAAHTIGIQDLANKKQVCVFVRAVNTLSTDLIREGFGTKDMAIKGKSSDIPPMSALIPRDQVYGKKGASAEEAKKFSAYNEASIKKGTATAIDLSLKADRIKDLTKTGNLTIVGSWLDAPPGADLSARSGVMVGKEKDSAREFTFWGEKGDDDLVTVFHAVEQDGKMTKGKPFEVMGNREGKPVTADYDLALVAPRMQDYGAEHTRPVKMTSYDEVLARRGLLPLDVQGPPSSVVDLDRPDVPEGGEPQQRPVHDLSRQGYFANVETQEATTQREYDLNPARDKDGHAPKKDFGNLSAFTRELIPQLNKSCDATGGREVFHHSDDAGNPFSVEADNYPMTVVLPDSALAREGDPTIRIVENRGDLKTLFKELKNTGFLPIGTYAWGEDLMAVRSDSFDAARNSLEAKLAERSGGHQADETPPRDPPPPSVKTQVSTIEARVAADKAKARAEVELRQSLDFAREAERLGRISI